MLEEILKSINLNLERIAKALEPKVGAMSNQESRSSVDQIVQNTIQSTGTNTAELHQTPTDVAIVQANLGTAIPTSEVQESFTQEQLAVAMSNAVSEGKMGLIQGILQKFGVQALTQINPSEYNKVAAMLKEAGVKV